jgi:hypothetical protein
MAATTSASPAPAIPAATAPQFQDEVLDKIGCLLTSPDDSMAVSLE